MLRIVHVEREPGHPTLRLEGKLVGPWVEELRRVCEPLLADGGPVRIDLSDLWFVDREGIALLRALTARHVALLKSSPFVAEQLKGHPCST